ncbi:NAD+ synthase [Rhodocyclus tenuis]|uniref:Glutamine-dependent NAD(+) synthetase n=1 Tax=Rhodocyclus tenuis TaxID=1066 RepID=A0A840G9Q5_RHOTE|nr:NAD+ synthase [Rhodocyclus tenuis]MBB4249063.1 NAD+ synthase/NAD+ synthase (glutamine-hydrolyzing) [Rhodocyclus tenuis]
MTLSVAIAQINAVVGDLAGNAERITGFAERAHAAGAALLLTPELALCGYPPEDLLLRPDFLAACDDELDALAARLAALGEFAVLVGHPLLREGRCYNAATLLAAGRRVATYCKQSLPNAQVFDEQRYFTPGDAACVVTIAGVRCGINICEDVWDAGTAERAHAAGAELLLVLNASPYHLNKPAQRADVLRERVAATGMPVLYANLVGGQDELVFDGASFALDADGTLRCAAPQFAEALLLVVIRDGRVLPGEIAPPLSPEAEVYAALVLGVRDYLGKNGFPGAIIGLSGGIDSALTLAIAVDALGAERVRAVMMPSPYTAQISLDDARAMAQILGVRYDEVPIAVAMQTFAGLLAPVLDAAGTNDTTEENVQARIRGLLLMALSNRSGALVLTTGNKSEMAVGYCTLYGDMAGGFAVIKDIAKTLVYRLSHWRNAQSPDKPPIPERIITRPPSAELKPDQTDQDSLPPYEVLDAIVEAYMENDQSPREIIARGYAEADVRRVVRLLRISEYKRRQSPVGIRVTQRGFGKDWRYPITNRYRDPF